MTMAPHSKLQALTLWQPWASAMMDGPKRVENRPWAPRTLRGPSPQPLWVALHAGAKVDPALSRPHRGSRFGRWGELRELWPEIPGFRDYAWPRGILGLVRFDRADPFEGNAQLEADPWASGPICWHVGQVLALETPIPTGGAQGFWTPTDDAIHQLRELYKAAKAEGKV